MKTNKFDFTGKVAVVTGASRGLGKSFAMALAEAGANICIVNTRIETGTAAAEEIAAKYGVKTMAVQADASNYEQINAMAKQVVEKFGRIDICVANAGIATRAAGKDIDPDEWRRIIDVNLTGVFFTNQAVGRIMIEQNAGTIINLGSIRAHTASHPHTGCVYPAAKAGVIMLTKSLAKEWAPYNVRVNAISPGYMKTEIIQDVADKADELSAGTAMGRIGEPEELQTALLYLASDYSSFTTGTEVLVDGGFMTF
ncbi:NAD(P)-dependent dehydrogenase, short-chain alcohol dehydrogenase family [Dethiosulfatibacter aminovorans DSM 17477]|uniref:NAD(P)-dependent dehydrogenase, short-chain alcohol dehydrogenase family n=1 Tax=Dethiosulfatibacter aminovorans DSM 17477 TaxID=1121476 RepID=A0A1M6EN54_9FIRM|nr:glucose 1-dehydrogenase [Dethiosulfatibacter aminovorans]SHI86967.1 NAD(P)-dependent dehydrogenase, short-chain alcohol dehydrogenase family [Dethiosulfatibacter aminovorans DSM 17477]